MVPCVSLLMMWSDSGPDLLYHGDSVVIRSRVDTGPHSGLVGHENATEAVRHFRRRKPEPESIPDVVFRRFHSGSVGAIDRSAAFDSVSGVDGCRHGTACPGFVDKERSHTHRERFKEKQTSVSRSDERRGGKVCGG